MQFGREATPVASGVGDGATGSGPDCPDPIWIEGGRQRSVGIVGGGVGGDLVGGLGFRGDKGKRGWAGRWPGWSKWPNGPFGPGRGGWLCPICLFFYLSRFPFLFFYYLFYLVL